MVQNKGLLPQGGLSLQWIIERHPGPTDLPTTQDVSSIRAYDSVRFCKGGQHGGVALLLQEIAAKYLSSWGTKWPLGPSGAKL